MALQPGTKAPSFRLSSTTGSEISLESLRGRKVVLYFYPKDSTPGCTQQACDLRDRDAALQEAGAVVLGVSKDSLASHDRFRAKYELPFPLLSDPDNEVARAYGAFGEKMMYGKTVLGTIRSTFLIDEGGTITHTWSPVKVAGHAEQVLAAVGGAPAPAAPAPKPRKTAAAGEGPGAITGKTAVGKASKAAKAVAERQAAASTRKPRG